jgi:subtilisin-like proprotein convertase family protein
MNHIYRHMKSLSSLTALVLFALLPFVGKAQVSLYTFSQLSGTYTPITGGTTLGVATNDDTSFPNNPIGFTFNYNNTAYTSFSVNANGFIALGTAVNSSYTSISTGTSNNIVSALNYDLQGNAAGNLRYETIGTAPNRILVVQWTDYGSWPSGSNPGDSYNFQIRLYETTDVVEVMYGTFTKNATNRNTQVGLRGNSNADFNNRTSTTSWATTTAGPLNSSTVSLTSTVMPASGLTFRWTPPPPTPMAYVSSAVTQASTANVSLNSINNQIIRIQINTTGTMSPFAATSFTINSTGTTNFATDVTNVSIWYTGSSPAFATTTLFGTTTSLAAPITGTQTLNTGANYFWVTYDVPVTGTIGNLLDAECTQIVMSGVGGTQVPVPTTAVGNRRIDYCVPTYSFGSGAGDYISNVQLGNISNPTGPSPSPYYVYYNPSTATTTTTLMQSLTYTITITPGTYTFNDVAAWIDFNHDGAFSATESLGQLMNMGPTPATASFTFTVPANAYVGTTRLRVREADQGAATLDPCTGYTFGEVEDYNIDIIPIPPIDLGVLNMTQPANNGCHGTSETVEVQIVNYGADTIDFGTNPVTINASVTGPNGVTFTPVVINTDSIFPGDTLVVLITNNYNMVAPGTYTFSASTSISGDGLAANDAMPNAVYQNYTPTVTASSDATICRNDSTPISAAGTSYGFGNQPIIITNSNPVNIVDFNTTGTNIVIPSTSFTAQDVLWVRIDSIKHTAAGQLSLTLISPNATQIDLSSLNGGFNDNYINTVFIPSATTPITMGAAPFTGNFLPEQPFSMLGAGNAQGTWQLRVNDNGFFDTGMLWSWTLAFPTPNSIVTYSWSPSAGLTSDTIPNPVASPTVTTSYVITVTDANGCSNRDTVVVNVNQLPVVSLGADTGMCVGDTLQLDAGPGNIFYQWSTSDVTQTIEVDTTGTYAVYVMDGNGCGNTDTINVALFIPQVNLGADTAICQGSTLILDAGPGFSTYNWSTLQTTQQIGVSTPDTFIVDVTDNNGCPAKDTIAVAVNALPVVALGNDTTFCSGNGVILDAGPGFNYLWSDSTVAQTLPVNTSGMYAVTITDANGCQDMDSVNITVNPTPVVNLGLDIIQCGGNVTLNAGNTGSTYQWSHGPVTQLTTVGTSNTYYVDVINSFGCQESDTVIVTIYPRPAPNAGNDTTICAGSTIVLDAGPGYASYNWTDNVFTATTQAISVSPGVTTTYYLSVTDNNGCTSVPADAITVTVEQPPVANFSSTVSGGMNVVFTNQSTGNNATYTWNFGDGSSIDFNMNTSHTYTANGTFMVTLVVTTDCGSDTVSLPVTITGVSIEESAAGIYNVYPNPNDGAFNIAITGAELNELIIEILDIQGKVVHSETDKNISGNYLKRVDLSGIAKGMYYLRMTTGTGMKIEKIVIQ